LATAVLFGAFTALMLIGTPIAFCLGMASFATIVYLGLPPLVIFQQMNSGMQNPRVGSAQAISSKLLGGALLLAMVAGCGGGGGGGEVTGPKLVNTGPGTTGTPDVSGYYTRVNNASASTCTPQNLPTPGGTVNLDPFTDTQPIRLYQNGTKLTLAYLKLPDLAADTGTVDLAGKIAMGLEKSGSKENLRAGNRQFYVDLTGTFGLTRPDANSPYTATGNYKYVYHENSATAPVYATCTRTIAITFTKTG
jgi:hypothetical protein